MINIDMSNIDQEFIDWKAIIARSLAGEVVSVTKAGVEVLQIKPTEPKQKTENDDWKKT